MNQKPVILLHPARGSNTKGCIGIQTNDKDSLEMIERIFKSSLIHRDSIPLGVTLLDK